MGILAGEGCFYGCFWGVFGPVGSTRHTGGRPFLVAIWVRGAKGVWGTGHCGAQECAPSGVPGCFYNTRSKAKSITAKSASPSGVRLLRSPPSASARFFVAMSA